MINTEVGNLDFLGILRQGPEVWNAWRKENPYVVIYLKGVNLREADLETANLQGANLEKANLQGANLQHADLEGAYLQKADLRGAYLQYTNLQGAYLQKADLQGAYLRGANFDGAVTKGARGLPSLANTSEQAAKPLVLKIDRGTAGQEEIQAYLNNLSALYELVGGSGLEFKFSEIEEAQA